MLDSILQRTCMKPSYLLRKQLLLSFGTTSLVAVVIVVIMACIFAIRANHIFNSHSETLLLDQVLQRALYHNRFVADTFSSNMEGLEGAVQIVVEVIKDRIVGYPMEGWEEDIYVPFSDIATSSNKYPLRSGHLPLEWDFVSNVNSSNINEHLQERTRLMNKSPELSTAYGSYFMQGACDPNENNPNSPRYYPNCTLENNNVVTGGVVQPTETNYGFYQKSADIAVFLKAIFEAHTEIDSIAVTYVNSGAGSLLLYPAQVRNGTFDPVLSHGCDWMREINPFTSQPYASDEEIARCHTNGTLVPQREYNPLERDWFKNAAVRPFGVEWFDPLYAYDAIFPVVGPSRSVFDRLTGQLIGCVAFSLPIESFDNLLVESKIHEESVLTIVRSSDGSLFSDSEKSRPIGGKPPFKIYEVDQISEAEFMTLRDCVYTKRYSRSSSVQNNGNDCYILKDGYLYAADGILWKNGNGTDDKHHPDFILIHRTHINSMRMDVQEDVRRQTNEEVLQITLMSLAVGFAGVVFVILIVWLVSRKLTQPLIWIEGVSSEIVNRSYEPASDWMTVASEKEPTKHRECIPHTEIDDLVREFRGLLHGFSGDGASSIANPYIYEVRNELTWQSDYYQIYSAPNVPDTEMESALFNKPNDAAGELANSGTRPSTAFEPNNTRISSPNIKAVVPALPKCNFDKNIAVHDDDASLGSVIDDSRQSAIGSSLFWWLLLLIVIPSLLTIAGICSIVSIKSMDTIPLFIDIVKSHSQDLESITLHSITSLKAKEAQTAIQTVIRDAHLLARFAGWLFFNGVNRSESFTFVDELTEECKTYKDLTCPVYESADRVPCACEWEDLNGVKCYNYTSTNDTRYLQHRFFFVEARDYDPATGDRQNVSLKLNDTVEQTEWWHNFSEMPGAERGDKASGFATSYDRVRVSSAMAAVEIPLYNYATQLNLPKHFVTSAFAFEADGMFTGFAGCRNEMSLSAGFQSTVENGAAEINPELCPLGKFGYDPRCRNWYVSGKRAFFENDDPVFVTAPYQFAVVQQFAASLTSPIVNPYDNSYVGQILFDFLPSSIQKLMGSVDELSFMITPEKNPNISDTVVYGAGKDGPGKDVPWQSENILDLLFPHVDDRLSHAIDSRKSFEKDILPKMKNGTRGAGTFGRKYADGKVENFSLIYEPVYARVLLPLRPDDFSRGVNVSNMLVYSVGIAYQDSVITEPWETIAHDVEQQVRRLRVIYYCIVVVVSVVFLLMTCNNSVSVTRPMITLLRMVQTINGGKTDTGIPQMQGGSKEVLQVYNAFIKLYKIVRGSNVAFFSGKLAWAYDFINEALKLFRKVGDEKAIGVACSNAGNTLHVMLYEDLNPRKGGIVPDFNTAVRTALEHYDEAIEIAEVQLQQASDNNVQVNFKQQLSDRLFNRALLLFLAHEAGCAHDYKEKSINDIKRVRELDSEVTAFRLEHKLLLEKSAEHFFRLLQRCLGLLEYYEELKEVWDPDEITRQADQFLYTAWNEPSAPLYQEVNRIGRLQQLESVVIQLQLRKGKVHDAARLAIRMFVEDEYLIEEALKSASLALLSLFRDPEKCPYPLAPRTKSSFESDLRRMLKSCRQISLDIGKCLVFAIEINEIWEGQDLMDKINRNCLRLFDSCCTDDDYVGVAAYTTEGDLNVPLGIKSENAGRQRSIIDLATTSTSEMVCSSVPYATQMLIDSTAATVNDSFILLITDGYSWDASQGDILLQQIEKLNSERNTTVHVVILGLEVEEEDIIAQCKKICAVSIMSKYMDISAENVENVFDSVRTIISGVDNAICNHGVVMERF